ncbi:MAG: peptidase C1 [Bacteroidia bacterium]|jgi:bleomycin hydrolase|nr:peptidase C1 [Bacteroidia bacterium]
MKTLKLIAVLILLLSNTVSYGQSRHDQLQKREQKAGFYDKDIMTGVQQYEVKKVEKPAKPIFKFDITKFGWYPKSVDEFSTWWKNNPISQGNSNTCWSFSTTSFFETEVYRQSKQVVKISEMFTAYWETVEKARGFVRTRGESNFDEGSEGNAVIRMYQMFGTVPLQDYTGLLPGQIYHSHDKMFKEMKAYLQNVKAANAWNEEEVVATIKSIQNHYMGVPPTKVVVNGKTITPQQYLSDVLKLNMSNYIDLTSLMNKPYWKKVEYEVPDNWWHDSSYYNVPLDEYMSAIKFAVRNGYTMMIGGDVSESGFDPWNQVAVVPSYDIPSEYIDESARLLRFLNGSTTDDHGMHLVGYLEKDGKDWYLIKDSGSGSRNCGPDSKNFGFYFMHEDYVKLKMMGVLIHRDVIKELLKKFN